MPLACVRGYPTDAGASILPHLLDAPERDRWMHLDRITGPFGRVGGAFDIGWNVQPKAPAITGRRVFLTDGRAISCAGSVMGYVADRKLDRAGRPARTDDRRDPPRPRRAAGEGGRPDRPTAISGDTAE